MSTIGGKYWKWIIFFFYLTNTLKEAASWKHTFCFHCESVSVFTVMFILWLWFLGKRINNTSNEVISVFSRLHFVCSSCSLPVEGRNSPPHWATARLTGQRVSSAAASWLDMNLTPPVTVHISVYTDSFHHKLYTYTVNVSFSSFVLFSLKSEKDSFGTNPSDHLMLVSCLLDY